MSDKKLDVSLRMGLQVNHAGSDQKFCDINFQADYFNMDQRQLVGVETVLGGAAEGLVQLGKDELEG